MSTLPLIPISCGNITFFGSCQVFEERICAAHGSVMKTQHAKAICSDVFLLHMYIYVHNKLITARCVYTGSFNVGTFNRTNSAVIL